MADEVTWDIVHVEDESEQTWSPRRKHCSVALNGKVLVLGGFVGDRATGTNDVWSYVIEENSWKCTNPEAGWSELIVTAQLSSRAVSL